MLGRALLGGRASRTAAARGDEWSLASLFSGAGVVELSVCITPCLREHGSVQQALGRFGAGLSHQESFKDLIYEYTQKFLAWINPKHLLLALLPWRKRSWVPQGVQAHSWYHLQRGNHACQPPRRLSLGAGLWGAAMSCQRVDGCLCSTLVVGQVRCSAGWWKLVTGHRQSCSQLDWRAGKAAEPPLL